jgi:hypothetical protein
MATTINADTVVGGAIVTGDASGILALQTGGTTALTLGTNQVATSAATYSDVYGKVRAIPQSGSAKTTSYTLAIADVGRFVEVGASGSITVPDATFAAGDAVVVFNNTSGNITITCSITTAYLAGTDADKATVTLATRGVANVLFISGTVCVLTGNVT